MALFNKPWFKLFLSFFIIYLVFARIDGWNENSRLDLTRAIVDEGRFEIDTYINNTGDRAYYDGHYYSDKFPGASFVAVPSYFVYKYLFGTPSINENFYEVNTDVSYSFMVFFIIAFTSVLFSSLTVVLIFKISKSFTKNRTYRYIVAIAYGLGTIAFSQATLFMGHAIATFFSFLAFYILYISFNNKSSLRYFLAGISIGLAIITSISTIFIFLGLIFYILFKKKHRFFIYFFLGSLLVISILLVYNFLIFKDITIPYSHLDYELFRVKQLFIEDSGCDINSISVSLPSRILRKLYFLDNKEKHCSVVFSILFQNNNSFPILVENNSFSESFVFHMNNDSTYYFERNYLFNNRLEPFSFKFLFDNSFVKISMKKSFQDTWLRMYDLNMKNNSFSVKDYGRGKIHVYNCSLFDRFTKKEFFCDELVYTFSDILLSRYKNNYCILSEQNNGTTTIREISYSKERLYKKNILSVNAVKLLFYPYRGLFFYSPVIFISFIGLFFMFKKYKPETLFIMFVFICLFLFQASILFWWGGSSFGSRYFLPAIPFLFIPFIFALKKVNMRIVLLFVFLSIFINLSGMQQLELEGVSIDNEQIFIEGELWNKVYSWQPIGNPLFNYYLPLFFSGGPQSMLLERIFQNHLPAFSNVIFLMFISIIIIYWPIRKN